MKSTGIALLVVGALAFLIGFNMDTTVATEFGGRVHNIGLMNDRQNFVIFAAVLAVIGAVFVGLANKNNVPEGHSSKNLDTRKCPFCAEFVKAEAIICRHCQKDLPPLVVAKVDSSQILNEAEEIREKLNSGADIKTKNLALSMEALELMTYGEIAVAFILLLLAIFAFFIYWLLGLLFLIGGLFYIGNTILRIRRKFQPVSE